MYIMPYHNSSKGMKVKGGRKHNASSKRTYKKKSKTSKTNSKNTMKSARKTAKKMLPSFSKMKGYSQKQFRELRKLSAL